MNPKRIPAIVMLLGGAVACIVTYINHYSFQDVLLISLLALLIFLAVGLIIKLVLDSFKLPSEEKVDDEGEVVEKQLDMSEGDEETLESVTENTEEDFQSDF